MMAVYVFRGYVPPEPVTAYEAYPASDAYPAPPEVRAEKLWEHMLDCQGSQPMRMTSGPSLAGESVFAAGDITSLYALDAATGEQRWRYKHSNRIQNQTTITDGVVLFRQEGGHVFAIDAGSGEKMWAYEPREPEVPALQISAAEGMVWLSTTEGTAGVEARTGAERYRLPVTNQRDALSSFLEYPLYSSGVLYIVGARTSAVDVASGQERWNLELDGVPSLEPAGPVVLDETLFFVAVDFPESPQDRDRQRVLFAVDMVSGKVEWRQALADPAVHVSAAVNGTVYASGIYLYAFDAASGQERWRFRTGDKPTSSITSASYSPPHVHEGLVYTADVDELFVLDDANGKELARLLARSGFAGDPVYSEDTVYYSRNDADCGSVLAVRISRSPDGGEED